jgi:hypothetical protein
MTLHELDARSTGDCYHEGEQCYMGITTRIAAWHLVPSLHSSPMGLATERRLQLGNIQPVPGSQQRDGSLRISATNYAESSK